MIALKPAGVFTTLIIPAELWKLRTHTGMQKREEAVREESRTEIMETFGEEF